MGRATLTLLLGLAFVAGCTRDDVRSPDPYDWTIHADTGGELQQWFDENVPLMPEELQQELSICLANVRDSNFVSSNRGPDAGPNQLAAKLDGRTVRELLIEGNELGVRLMETRVKREAEAVIQFVNATDGTDPRQQKLLERERARLEAMKQRLTKAQEHLAELHASGLKN